MKAGLERAIEIAGGQRALARLIGVHQPRLWYWLNGSQKGVPAEYVHKVEQATGVSRYRLRPDLFKKGKAA